MSIASIACAILCMMSAAGAGDGAFPAGFAPSGPFGELLRAGTFDPGIRVVINAPPMAAFDRNKSVRLVVYALPNGNTIEWTAGRRIREGEDWHFEIQHIAAQTRLLRELDPSSTVVVAYVEAAGRSWPTWRRKQEGGSGPIAAQQRSRHLVRGRWVHCALVVTIPMAIYLGIGSAVSSALVGICIGVATATGGGEALLEGRWLVWSQWLAVLPMALALPLAFAGGTQCLVDFLREDAASAAVGATPSV